MPWRRRAPDTDSGRAGPRSVVNDYRALLAAPKFCGLLLALLCNGLGNWCVIASLPILVADRFGTGMALVLSLGLRILPKVLLAPAAGILLRRFGPARIASIALVPLAVLTALLPLCHSLWLLQTLVAVTGTLDVFITPGLLSLRGPVMPAGLEMVGNTLCSAANRAAQVHGAGAGWPGHHGGVQSGVRWIRGIDRHLGSADRTAAPVVPDRSGSHHHRGMVRDAIWILTDRSTDDGPDGRRAGHTWSLLGGMRPFLFWANHDCTAVETLHGLACCRPREPAHCAARSFRRCSSGG